MGIRIHKQMGYGFSLKESSRDKERDFVHAVNTDRYPMLSDSMGSLEAYDSFCQDSYGDYLLSWGWSGVKLDRVLQVLKFRNQMSIEACKRDVDYEETRCPLLTAGVDADDESDDQVINWTKVGICVPAITELKEWYRTDAILDYYENVSDWGKEPFESHHFLIKGSARPLGYSGVIDWETGEYVHDEGLLATIFYARSEDPSILRDKSCERLGLTLDEVHQKYFVAPPHAVMSVALWKELFAENKDVWVRRMNPMIHTFWS